MMKSELSCLDLDDQIWYLNESNRLHREDGPAIIEKDGEYECWYYNGLIHRLNGPAIIRADGIQEWYVRDIRVKSYDDYQNLSGCSDSQLTLLKIKYGEIFSNENSS